MNTEQVPLNPVTEEDMSKVKEVFTSMVDNVLAATKLQAQVQDLVVSVNGLQHQVDRLRSQNDWLDEQLTNIRKQRDEAIAAQQAADQARHQAETDRDFYKAKSDADQATAQSLQQSLDQARRDRDDAMMKVMELEDNLAATNARLAKVHEVLGIPSPIAAPNPVPQPSPVPVYQSEPEPQPEPEPAPAPAPPEPYRW